MNISSVLVVISWFFSLFGLFFIVGGIRGLLHNKNLYMKIHCLHIINIYGINITLLAIGINSCDANFFFKCFFMIVLNTITTLTVGHVVMRKAFLTNVPFDCKERQEIEKIIEQEREERMIREEEEKIRKEEEERKKKREEEERMIIARMEEEKEKERREREELEKKKKEEEEAYEKERLELQEKIKEQKRKLKDKIAKARKNAKITRKQSEIDKTEKMIKDILDKYGLTEEMLEE